MPDMRPFLGQPAPRKPKPDRLTLAARAARRRHWLNLAAGVLFGLSFACALVSLLLEPWQEALGGDGLDWLAVAFMLSIGGAFVYPERGR